MEREQQTRKDRADLTETTRPGEPHERQNAMPSTGDLKDPAKVWRNAETTPDRGGDSGREIGHGRVADAGDVGGHATSPYGAEVQADALAKQTDRDRRSGGVEKPRK